MKYERSIIPIIEAHYQNFTASEKIIADFFMNNKEVSDFSAQKVAGHLYTSEASLSRFSRKCGFKGYREFIYRYQEGFKEERKDASEDTRNILDTYQELLTKAYSLIDEAQIIRIANIISRANQRVFVYGKGSSGIAAEEFKNRLMRFGVDIECIVDTHIMKMNTAVIRSRDLLIGISVSGQAEEVLQALESGKRKGAVTVLISAAKRSEWAQWCDEVVLIASKENLDLGKLISPQFPVLVICDVLYANVMKHNRNDREALHRETLIELGRIK
ncbi:MurR/RpiR family transcriptional regulator [Kineothrix sp. MB12-C1]|uniref:MurR/RpiR family transcriptional regulator n=1 Tax=Kineothrix sp. MB12-C1 TaxID=3070215 RepID=UPI0027D1F383|nr:MurR/RpiR family transcriptional regulator [Kineothrix sp. MB12-C1]WMC91904.1 MurR/RpiR family transcriptional regulator [Kineothrix sp. MB12-C1]